MLHAECEGQGQRVVLVHGFTQNRLCWGPVARRLALGHQVVRVDAPGHGRSSGVRADIPGAARLLARAGGRAVYVGYSMGGRMALRLALDIPEVVDALVLLGATPGIRDPALRRQRREADEALASQIEVSSIEEVVSRWLAGPLFAGLSPEAACAEARLENTVHGLASSLRLAGTGTQEPMWERLGELAMPVLAVTGEHDERFGAIAREMVTAIGPNASHATVQGAGHAAHLEDPEAFLDVLEDWLAALAAG